MGADESLSNSLVHLKPDILLEVLFRSLSSSVSQGFLAIKFIFQTNFYLHKWKKKIILLEIIFNTP